MMDLRPAPPLKLLQDPALDAIVIHTSGQERWQRFLRLFGVRNSYEPRIPTVDERLDRYHTAACLYPLHADPYKAQLREELGALFLDGWKRGKRPQLRRIHEQMPALKKRRHLRAVS